MTEKNRNTRAGSPGGDRPLRRPAKKTSAPHAAARQDARPAKPGFDKPRSDKPRMGEPRSDKPSMDKPRSDKPRFDRPRLDRPAAPRAQGERDKRPDKRPDKPPAKQRAAAPAPREKAFEGERIAKVMARAGVCSRRDAEFWIAEGRVAVNGRVQTSPAFNVRDNDNITIDGAPMQARERTRLFLFHKPTGYVTTARDEEGRATVFSYLEERHPDLPRLVSVGRLDINTEGLLLLTNDGGLARTLELPATGWTRRYRVRAHGAIDQAQLDSLGDGVTIDGVHYAPIEARLEREQGANVWIAMNLTEGKNREIKRVMAHLGLDVTRLIRVSYGPFQLADLAEGAVEEVRLKTLREQLGKSLAELAGVDFAAPLREMAPAEQQEIRQRAEKRPRKHVSTLRKEQDEQRDAGPRARVSRGAVADRKGRAVAVERVTPTRAPTRRRDETAPPPSRNARRFEAMRADGAPHQPKARTERPSRDSSPRGERFPREDGRRRDERAGPEQRRAPRFDDQRGARPPTRAPRERSAEGRDERPRTQRFEKRPDDRASGQRNYRTANRDDARIDKRPPRRDGDEARRDTRGASATRQERPRTFDKRPPRSGERDFSAGDRAPRERKFDQPRSGGDARPSRSGGPSRGPHKGPRSGPGTGPAGGRGAPRKGPPKGPFKGPRKGPPKGPFKGPRKPRGA
ncbi:MAG: pseudouridine synthase [Methylocystis sp.]|jgi:23S rRNA pseudouridine2605 synthase